MRKPPFQNGHQARRRGRHSSYILLHRHGAASAAHQSPIFFQLMRVHSNKNHHHTYGQDLPAAHV